MLDASVSVSSYVPCLVDSEDLYSLVVLWLLESFCLSVDTCQPEKIVPERGCEDQRKNKDTDKELHTGGLSVNFANWGLILLHAYI